MALVCNKALKMGKGKLCAQCAHAAVGIFDVAASQAVWQDWFS